MNLRVALMLVLSMKFTHNDLCAGGAGVAVLFCSSDLPGSPGVADRIVVMREGEIAGELLHEQADERQALSLRCLKPQLPE